MDLLTLIVVCLQISYGLSPGPPTPCKWTQYLGQNFRGGSPGVTKPLGKCKEACEKSKTCAGLDFVPSTSRCYYHTVASMVDGNKRQDSESENYQCTREGRSYKAMMLLRMTWLLLYCWKSTGQPEPIAFWPFDQQHGPNDSNKELNVQSVGITHASGPCGIEGAAVQFSRDLRSRITVENNARLRLNGSFSITSMVFIQDAEQRNQVFCLGKGIRIRIHKNRLVILRIHTRSEPSKYKMNSKINVTEKEWFFMGVSYLASSGRFTFVINNQSFDYIKDRHISPITSGNVVFGSNGGNNEANYTFGGRLASFRIFDRGLTDDEMMSFEVICNKTEVTTVAPPGGSLPADLYYRESLHAGYTRKQDICKSDKWAYSNQTGMCYMFFGVKLDQDSAIEACKKVEGELLQITNQDEQDFIDHVLLYDFEDHWTLGKRDPNTGNCSYAGKELDYTNFLDGDVQKWAKKGDDCIGIRKLYYERYLYLTKGKWDLRPCDEKKKFVCQHIAKRCPPLPSDRYVMPLPPKPYIELTINYTCEPGYEMPNYTLKYLEWQNSKPANATVNDTEAWQEQKPNITTMPSMVFSCIYPGNYTEGSLAPCEPKSCKRPPRVAHTEMNSTDRVFPSWIKYTCTHGYHYRSDNTSSRVGWCGPDTDWIDVPPDCDPVECEAFPRVGNATVNSNKNRYKETVVWTCNPGFMYPDGSVRQWVGCRENYVNWQIGRWNISKLDDCIPLVCPEPPIPSNTTVNSNDTSYKAILTYSCITDEFEFPSGEAETLTECSDEAQWKPLVPPCTKKAAKLKTKGKKYTPDPKESPAAEKIGSLALIILIILLVIMVLLDINTCYKGLLFLRYNLKHRKPRSHVE